MIAIHNVVAASATVGLLGQEGTTLRKTIIPTLYYLAVVGVLGLVLMYVVGVDAPLRRLLVDAGHRMRVYVPFGRRWYEYSMRRLKENPRIAGYAFRNFLGLS